MQRLIDQHPLRRGSHATRDDGMCAMEMVAWLAGEPHSDEPRCACPVIAAFVRACNDAQSDENRNRFLRPLVPQLVNTRAAAAEAARGLLVVDAMVRRWLPTWLLRHRRADEARLLRDLPPVRDADSLRAAQRATEHYARDQHAALWVLQRAVDGVAPARYVAGAVQLLRAMHDGEAWAGAAEVVRQMARRSPQAQDIVAADGTA